jgi:hypothetical protein
MVEFLELLHRRTDVPQSRLNVCDQSVHVLGVQKTNAPEGAFAPQDPLGVGTLIPAHKAARSFPSIPTYVGHVPADCRWHIDGT